MTARIVWMVSQHDHLNFHHMHDAVAAFYTKYKMKPNVIRVPLTEYTMLLQNMPAQYLTLEKGKQYGSYLNTACGPILIDLMDEEQTSVMGNTNHSLSHGTSIRTHDTAFFVENDEVDKAFEKHILEEK